MGTVLRHLLPGEWGNRLQPDIFAPVEPQFALHYNANTYSIANIPAKPLAPSRVESLAVEMEP